MRALADSEAIIVAARQIVDEATQKGRLCAEVGDAAGITILVHALAMAAAEMAGPTANRDRLRTAVAIASAQVADAVPLHFQNLYGRLPA